MGVHEAAMKSISFWAFVCKGKDFRSPVDKALVDFIWSSGRGGDAGHVAVW